MKPYGICVNAIRPGPTDTDMHKDKPPEFRAKLRNPDDVSKLAVYLALQTVDTMTGESIDLKEWEQGLWAIPLRSIFLHDFSVVYKPLVGRRPKQ